MAVESMSPIFEVFVLRQDWAIDVADVLRAFCLVSGLIIAALYARAFLGRGIEDRARAYPGFRWRLASIALFTLFTCITEYDRLNDPVTILLPIALVALWFAVAGLYVLPRRAPTDREEWLKGDL